MRRRIAAMVAMVMMVLMMSAPAALADPGRIRDPQPITPPGMEDNKGNGGLNNPKASEQAPDISTGRGNRFDQGCPQNGSTECL